MKKRISLSHSILWEIKSILDPQTYNYFLELITTYDISKGSVYWDIACFLVLCKLRKSVLTKKWIEFWVKHSKKSRQYKHLVYIVPETYLYFLNTKKENILPYFNILLEDKKLGFMINWGEYIEILYSLISELKPTFTKNEFEVFKTILYYQTESNTLLAEKTSISRSNISRYKKKLIKRRICTGYRINKSRLNTELYLMLTTSSIKHGSITDLLPESPFLRVTYESFVGCVVTHSFFVVPKHKEAIKDLEALVGKILTHESVYENRLLLFLNEGLVSFNYDTYDFSNGKWLFTPTLNRLFGISNPLNIEKKHPIFSFFEGDNDTNDRVILNEVQKKLLNFIWTQDPTSIRAIHKDFSFITGGKIKRLPFAKVREYINQFKKERILAEKYLPCIFFGLTNIVVLFHMPLSYQKSLHNFLAYFPEVYSNPCKEKNEEYIHVILRTPKENTLQTMELLRHHFKDYIELLTIVDKMFQTKKELPLDRFDTLYNKWDYVSGELLGEIK